MTLNRLCFPRFAPAFIASVFIASVFIASGVVLGDEQLSLAAQQSIDLRDEDDRPARVAILFDRSMSMGLPADDGRPRPTCGIRLFASAQSALGWLNVRRRKGWPAVGTTGRRQHGPL